MRTPKSVLMLSAAIALLAPAAVLADAWLPGPGEYYSEFRASHISSSSYYDSAGVRHDNPAGGLFEQRELFLYNEFGWKQRASLIVGLPGRSVTQRSDPRSASATVTGFADLLIGCRVQVFGGPTALAVEADWRAPLGYQHHSEPALGPGQQNVGGRVSFGTHIGSIGFVEATGGYVHRFEQPLDEVAVSADAGVWIGPSLLIEGTYLGLSSVGSADAGTGPELNAHRAGPRFTYRLDGRLDLFAGARLAVSGKNVEKSDEFFAGLALKKTRLNRLQGYLGGTQRP